MLQETVIRKVENITTMSAESSEIQTSNSTDISLSLNLECMLDSNNDFIKIVQETDDKLNDDGNNSKLNPAAKEFVPFFPIPESPTNMKSSNLARVDLLDDVVAQSPKRPDASEIIDVPSQTEFETEATNRPHETEMLDDFITAVETGNLNLKEAAQTDEKLQEDYKEEFQTTNLIPFTNPLYKIDGSGVVNESFYEDKATEELNKIQELPLTIITDDNSQEKNYSEKNKNPNLNLVEGIQNVVLEVNTLLNQAKIVSSELSQKTNTSLSATDDENIIQKIKLTTSEQDALSFKEENIIQIDENLYELENKQVINEVSSNNSENVIEKVLNDSLKSPQKTNNVIEKLIEEAIPSERKSNTLDLTSTIDENEITKPEKEIDSKLIIMQDIFTSELKQPVVDSIIEQNNSDESFSDKKFIKNQHNEKEVSNFVESIPDVIPKTKVEPIKKTSTIETLSANQKMVPKKIMSVKNSTLSAAKVKSTNISDVKTRKTLAKPSVQIKSTPAGNNHKLATPARVPRVTEPSKPKITDSKNVPR